MTKFVLTNCLSVSVLKSKKNIFGRMWLLIIEYFLTEAKEGKKTVIYLGQSIVFLM